MNNSIAAIQRFASSRAALVCALGLVTVLFAVTRMQFWLDRRVPSFLSDSQTYLALAFDMARSVQPVFDLRTPGYPLLLYAVLQATGSLLAVILLQQLVTLGSAYVLCIASFITRR